MEFVISLEDEFGMDISDHDIENLITLSDIVSYIQNKNVR
ncbi:phosphopantetheine-binding protein [Streptococcus pyogenes]